MSRILPLNGGTKEGGSCEEGRDLMGRKSGRCTVKRISWAQRVWGMWLGLRNSDRVKFQPWLDRLQALPFNRGTSHLLVSVL